MTDLEKISPEVKRIYENYKLLSDEKKEDLMQILKNDEIESQKKNLIPIQQEILTKPYMTPHHKNRLQKKTDELIKARDKVWLKKLKKGIDFTEKWGLIVHIAFQWDIKFAPKQATFEDIKGIDWLELDKNVRTKNDANGQIWLWIDFEAVEKIRNAGKKICTTEEYANVADAFPGINFSMKIKNFVDLLWVEQIGYYYKGRNLWSDSFDGRYLWEMEWSRIERHRDGGDLQQHAINDGLGVRFLED